MDLGFLLLTDHSEAINGKLYVNGGGWNMLRFPELPQEMSFGIGFAIDIAWHETNRRHELELRVEGPDGETLGDELTFELETGRPPGVVEGQDQRIVLSLTATMTFETAGPHAVVVRAAEAEIGRGRFYVVEVPVMLAGS